MAKDRFRNDWFSSKFATPTAAVCNPSPKNYREYESASVSTNRCKTRSFSPAGSIAVRGYFFSITHCRGCWCLRAKSITCVTLVSAIS